MNAPLVETLGLHLQGVTRPERCVGLMVLAWETAFIKEELRYSGTGSWQAWHKEVKSGERPTWEAYCKTRTDFTAEALAGYLKCWEAVTYRVSLCRKRGAKKLLRLVKRQPSHLSAADRAWMVRHLLKLVITKGETRSYLLKEYREGLPPKGSEAATTPAATERAKQLRVQACMLEEAQRREAALLKIASSPAVLQMAVARFLNLQTQP